MSTNMGKINRSRIMIQKGHSLGTLGTLVGISKNRGENGYS